MFNKRDQRVTNKENKFFLQIRTFVFLLSFFWFLSTFSVYAQDTIQRPKIGLVLSGGGAKGLAHIGVLKVIDSLGIKIDYVGGTSMGAIIGGLYASGYTGKELDVIFRKVSPNALVQDYQPRKVLNSYQKRSSEVYALALPFDKFKVSFPKALSNGLYNYHLLTKLTKHVSDIKDFEKLPIPFFCIATNIENGEQVVLDSGILQEAVLASGAVPTLFNPIVIDGVTLIDGGIVNNYPVEEIRKRGADIVIGVDVQDGLKSKKELEELTALLVQITNYSMIQKMEDKIKLTNIYIKPEITNYNIVSFDEGKDIIKKGTIAANNSINDLTRLNFQKEKKTINKPLIDSIYINDIKVDNLKNYTRAYVYGKLKFKTNKKISYQKLIKGIDNLNASQNFKSIHYSFTKNNDGEQLVVDLEENENFAFLKFGIHFDDVFKSSLLTNFTQKKLLARNDELSLDIVLGDNFRYNLNYYLDNGFSWSIGVNSKYTILNSNMSTDFQNGAYFSATNTKKVSVSYKDLTNQLYIQSLLLQNFPIGIGVEFKSLNILFETFQNQNLAIDRSDYFSLFTFLKYDTLDNKYFPKNGLYFYGQAKQFVYSSNFNSNYENFARINGEFLKAFSITDKLSVQVQSELGISIGENIIDYLDYSLGGYGFTNLNNFRPFFGYNFSSINADSYIKGNIEIDYEFYKKNHFNILANYANVRNKIFKTGDWFLDPKYSGYALGYGYESLVGPIEVKHSWSPETSTHYTWFTVGFIF